MKLKVKVVISAIALVVVALVLALPAGASADSLPTLPNKTADGIAKTQTAVSPDGWWRQIEAGDAPRYVDGGGPGNYSVVIDFVYPQGKVAGNGPQHPDEADIRKPWASIFGIRSNVKGTPGHGVVQVCSSFVNPTYRVDEEPYEKHYWVDIPCNDGRGYDFYRARWDYRVVREDPPYCTEDLPQAPEPSVGDPSSLTRFLGVFSTGSYVVDSALPMVDYALAMNNTCKPETRNFDTLREYRGWGVSADYAPDSHYSGSLSGATWYTTPYSRKRWAIETNVCGHKGDTVECFPRLGGGSSASLSPLRVDASLNPPSGPILGQ